MYINVLGQREAALRAHGIQRKPRQNFRANTKNIILENLNPAWVSRMFLDRHAILSKSETVHRFEVFFNPFAYYKEFRLKFPDNGDMIPTIVSQHDITKDDWGYSPYGIVDQKLYCPRTDETNTRRRRTRDDGLIGNCTSTIFKFHLV
jgi:hypothetical protein